MTRKTEDHPAGRPGADELTEHLTVLRAQLGEESAHLALFQRYNARLLYFLRKTVSPKHEAEDLLQEVWVTVIKKVHTLERPEAFRPWLYRIARNRAISRSRRPIDLPLETVPEVAAVAAPEAERSDAELFAKYDARALHEALEELTPSHREVLTLRFLEELTYAEIAEIVDCGVGTVRSRIHYAKRTLRKILDPQPNEGEPHDRVSREPERAPARRRRNA